jgi:glycine/D-amino acid oxidase-like deaminating enzyme
MHVDYIIVGQGLAGSAVAYQLIKRGKKILVIDQSHDNTSSRIAAGLFNPLTGRNLKKTWLADPIFRYLHDFYPEAERATNEKFFHSMPLYRPFFSVEEQNEWMAKSIDPAFESYVNKIYTRKTVAGVNDKFGGLLLNQCGYLESDKYVKAIRGLIEKEGIFIEHNLGQEELEVSKSHVSYKDFTARKIIFCEGVSVRNSKWFSGLSIIPLKGETLTIQSSEPLQQIINRGVYIVPAGKNKFRIGSTYNLDVLKTGVTEEAKIELTEKLNELINFTYQIVSQEWGIRPTTRDRRPIMGAYPENPSTVIFNGLGTKGVSLSPYLSANLVAWLEGETDLNKEVDVNRYKSLYSKFTK